MNRLLCSTILSLPLCVGVACAQQPPRASQGLTEVVVTAQRRVENLQKIGLAVSAISPRALIAAGITKPDDLSRLVPSLQVNPSGGNMVSFFIRGVGTNGSNAYAENAIGVSLDGIYLGLPSGMDGLLYDLDRVEVLKGPQGTLYGRNATGGAINIITTKPKLNTTSGDFNVEYGNYNSRQLEGGITLPLADDLAIRVAGQYVAHDGYLSDGYDDQNEYAARTNILWRPTSNFSVQIGGDYNHQGGKGAGGVLMPANSSDHVTPPISARIGGSDPRSIAALTARYGGLVKSGIILPPQDNGYLNGRADGVGATVNLNTDIGTFTLLPAYRETVPDFVFYRPGFYGLEQATAQQESTELRLASKDEGALRYVLGGFYFHQMENFASQFTQGNTIGTQEMGNLGTDSYALFGQATYHVTNHLRVIGGLRFTDEHVTQNGDVRTNAPKLTNLPFTALNGADTYRNVTYKAGLEYDLTPQSLLYANIATGFKAGGFYAASGNASFAPEELTAYTLGSKNRFLDNSLQVNLEAFYWQYHNQQISYVGPVQVNPGTYVAGGVTTNVGQSRMYGLDLDMKYRLTANDTISGELQYLNSRYNSFVYQGFSGNGAPLTTACSTAVDPAIGTIAPAKVYTLDCTGKPGINSPTISVNLDYAHNFPLNNGMSVIADINTQIQTSRYVQIDYVPNELQPAYTMSNLSLTLQSAAADWSLSGFVNNVENSTVISQSFVRPIANANYAGLEPPRTYGVRANYHF